MPSVINLASEMAQQLPTEMVGFMRRAGEMTAEQGQNLYLVGGVVRDLLLRGANFDLDLVVEGDALKLVPRLADISQGKIITHPRFHTAKIQWQQWSVDLASARSETYDQPGTLPSVQPGTIALDLGRRDFTINAMAIELTPGRYGQLLDPYRGRADLEQKLIRVLHDRSFIDDATRIWRALRYEQRLDFQLEAGTIKLLKRDIPMLETISGNRIRHELELVFKEESPEKVLCRAAELGALAKLHPSLQGDDWLAAKFKQARSDGLAASGLYLALLAYRLTDAESEQLIAYLRVTKVLAQTLRDSHDLKAQLGALADPALAPSRIYSLLYGYSPSVLIANSLASDSAVAQQHIRLFLDKLRYVKPALTGNDLQRMGIAPGPQMKEILNRLHEARLDGKVSSKKGEEELVGKFASELAAK